MAFCIVNPLPMCMLSAAGSIQPTSCSSQSSTLEQRLKEAAKKIDEVEKDFNNLRRAMPKFWQDEFDCLH